MKPFSLIIVTVIIEINIWIDPSLAQVLFPISMFIIWLLFWYERVQPHVRGLSSYKGLSWREKWRAFKSDVIVVQRQNMRLCSACYKWYPSFEGHYKGKSPKCPHCRKMEARQHE